MLGLLPGGAIDVDLEGIWGEGLSFSSAFAPSGPGSVDGSVDDDDAANTMTGDGGDAVSVCSVESNVTFGTAVSVGSYASSSYSSIAGGAGGPGGAGHSGSGLGGRGRQTGAWEDHVGSLVRASLVEKAPFKLGRPGEANYVAWLAAVEGWNANAFLTGLHRRSRSDRPGLHNRHPTGRRVPPGSGRPTSLASSGGLMGTGVAGIGRMHRSTDSSPLPAATPSLKQGLHLYSMFPFVTDFAESLALEGQNRTDGGGGSTTPPLSPPPLGVPSDSSSPVGLGSCT